MPADVELVVDDLDQLPVEEEPEGHKAGGRYQDDQRPARGYVPNVQLDNTTALNAAAQPFATNKVQREVRRMGVPDRIRPH